MGNRKVKIIADSTCDLSPEQIAENDISIIPLCIVLDDKSYFDLEEITPDEIYQWAEENKRTPKTAAISIEHAVKLIKTYREEEEDIIFFGISEAMSTTCNVMRLAAQMMEEGNTYVIDSMSLSTGVGLQVLKAAEMAKQGMAAEEIVEKIEAARGRVRASFIVDTLTYLARGGRCSGATALLAGALKIHPCIRVMNGNMEVGSKYRGSLGRAIKQYLEELKEELLHAEEDLVFITHSGIDEEIIVQVKKYLEDLNHFKEIVITRAGGVISSHCGPGTLGVLFYEK